MDTASSGMRITSERSQDACNAGALFRLLPVFRGFCFEGSVMNYLFIRADAVMHGKQSSRIVFLLYRDKAWIIGSPVRALVVVLKKTALGYIRPPIRGDHSEFVHAPMDPIRTSSASRNVRLMARNAGIGWTLAVCADGQRKCCQHGRIHRSVAGRLYGFARRPGKAFVEMQFYSVMT